MSFDISVFVIWKLIYRWLYLNMAKVMNKYVKLILSLMIYRGRRKYSSWSKIHPRSQWIIFWYEGLRKLRSTPVHWIQDLYPSLMFTMDGEDQHVIPYSRSRKRDVWTLSMMIPVEVPRVIVTSDTFPTTNSNSYTDETGTLRLEFRSRPHLRLHLRTHGRDMRVTWFFRETISSNPTWLHYVTINICKIM